MNGSSEIRDIMNEQRQTLAGMGNFALGLASHIVNVKQNRRNMQAIERQNAQAAAESEKAYQRSKPTTQVTNMRQAGMSQAGAINALNGGGSYTPAPVAAGQEQMLDFSGIQGALANMAQVGLANAQLKEQKRQFNENLNLERDRFEYDKKRNTENDSYDNIIKTFQAAKIESEAQTANLEWLVKEFTHNERIDSEKQRLIAEKSKSLADELQSKLYKGALEDVDSETLKSLFKYQAVLEMLGNIGQMTTEKAIQIIHDVKEILIPG